MKAMSKVFRVAVNLLLALVFMSAMLPASTAAAQTETPYTGINWMISATDGSTQPYGVFIPNPSDKTSPRPVLFIGHGAGGRASVPSPTADPQRWILNNNKNWIVVNLDYRGPQANNQGQYDVFDVINDLENVKAYTLDHNRFYLYGESLGGSDTYRLGFRYPDMWAAIAPRTGWTDYREFWPHWYEHWDKGTEPRGSMFEGFRSTDLNVRNDVANLKYYVDPVLQPMLETASSLWQAVNGMHVPAYIMSCYNDPTNLRVNQEEVRDVYQAHNYEYVFKQSTSDGHGCPVLNWSDLLTWFDAHVRVTNPLVATYTTNSLQYNHAYWLQLDQFVTEKEWATLTASIDPTTRQKISITANNLAQFSLKLNSELIANMNAKITVTINNEQTLVVQPSSRLTFTAKFDQNNAFVRWVANSANPSAGLVKKNGISGPFSDVFSSPFVVVYGTQGTAAENADSLRSAQEFAMEWNNWMILHIGNYGAYQTATPGQNVWEGISTFPYYQTNRNANYPGGPNTPQVNTAIIKPIADVNLTGQDIHNKNLILFGEPSTNAVFAEMQDDFPFKFGPGSITVNGRVYADGVGNNPKDAARIDYSFIYPNPLNPKKYVAISRYGLWMDWKDPAAAWLGFTSTGIEFQDLDFWFPDYFIGWRLNGELMGGVNGMYFADSWFEAGYFNNHWQLDHTAPITTANVSGTQTKKGVYTSDVKVTLNANDNPGGFGVAYVQPDVSFG
jgi:pimeloyl-ACP methyl ester carboxylesterase